MRPMLSVLLALALACEGFSISVEFSLLSERQRLPIYAITSGAAFALFGTVFAVIGYFVSLLFADSLYFAWHWIAFVLILYIALAVGIAALNRMRVRVRDNPIEISFKPIIFTAAWVSVKQLASGIVIGVSGADRVIFAVTLFALSACAASCGVFFGKIIGRRAAGIIGISGAAVVLGIGVSLLVSGLTGAPI